MLLSFGVCVGPAFFCNAEQPRRTAIIPQPARKPAPATSDYRFEIRVSADNRHYDTSAQNLVKALERAGCVGVAWALEANHSRDAQHNFWLVTGEFTAPSAGAVCAEHDYEATYSPYATRTDKYSGPSMTLSYDKESDIHGGLMDLLGPLYRPHLTRVSCENIDGLLTRLGVVRAPDKLTAMERTMIAEALVLYLNSGDSEPFCGPYTVTKKAFR